MSVKELHLPNLSIEGIDELEGIRDNDLGLCFIDFTKRDIEEGKFNIDITVYVKPGVREDLVMPAIQKACIDIWGEKPTEDLELFYVPTDLGGGKKLSLEVDGDVGVYATFGVTIKHPMSQFYNLNRLKQTLLKRASAHLEKVKR